MDVDGAVDGTGRGAIREVRGRGRSCGVDGAVDGRKGMRDGRRVRGARREVHGCGWSCGGKKEGSAARDGMDGGGEEGRGARREVKRRTRPGHRAQPQSSGRGQ